MQDHAIQSSTGQERTQLAVSAMAMVLFVLILIIALVQLRIGRSGAAEEAQS